MFTSKQNSIWIGSILIALILLTRTNHFGDSIYLPDATLAVLFLGGLLVARSGWLGLAIVAAFGMDFYALGYKGVSDYCMSPGYWGLIPTYALVWGAGRFLAKREKPFSFLPYALFGWAAASLAFVISNAFWYSFSDKVATLSIVEFSQRVAQYYTPYVGYAMMYLGVAWVVTRLFANHLSLKKSHHA
ncbi:MAG TPA: hypothetical protein VK974_11530 [Methylophilaceae bacterium]|nr:hypothetical protein [Methylophilaceae bacterium]